MVKDSLPRLPPHVVVQEDEPQETVELRAESCVFSIQDEDGEWCVVDRSGRAARSQKQHATVIERRTRKKLPQAWLQMDEDAQTTRVTPEDASVVLQSSPNKPLQRAARIKGPHTQLPQAQANSLESKPSKPTLTKATASKTPGYASPTKASAIRTAGTFESARPPSPCKSRSVRADTIPNAAMLSSDQQSPSRPVASTAFDTARRKIFPAHDKSPATSVPFGLDGTCESVHTGLLKTFSGNSVRPSKKAKLDLRINIPDPSERLPRPGSPSRIPIAVPSNTPAADHEPVTSNRVAAQHPGSAEADGNTSKPVDRASILEPIRRRLSSTSATSHGRSSTSSTEPQRRNSGPKQSKKTVYVEGSLTEEPDMINDSEMSSTMTDTQTKMHHSSDAVASSLTPAPEPASTLLLDTIKKTAKAHAVRQSNGQTREHLAPSSNVDEAQQAKKMLEFQEACRAQHITCGSSPEKDPAVLKCGPVKARSRKGQERSSSGPARFSLRATAAHFVPAPTSEDGFGPLSAPEATFSLSLPPTPATLSLAPALAFAPQLASTLPPICPPMLPTAVPEESTQQFLTQCPLAFDGHSSWIPDGEWKDLPYTTKQAIFKERKERGSSSASSPDMSSTMFSNFTTSPSLSSLGPLAEPGLELYRPQWDWMQPGQGGVRFGRAPLPIMPELQHDSHQRKGWDVKSAAPGWRYGWRGGDGLEISFKGDGPIAERNPNAPVNFNEYDNDFYGKPTKTGQKYGGRNSSERNEVSPNSRVREWARNANYPSVPCGNFEVVQAIEHLPYYPNTWCHSCLPGHV